MIKKKNFQFVLHRENFLTSKQCDELIEKFWQSNSQKSTVAGTYKGDDSDVVNEDVRKVQEIRLKNDVVLSDGFKLTKNIIVACEMSNLLNFQFYLKKPYELEDIVVLRYEDTDKYDWHLDIGDCSTSLRKITAIIQLSDEKDYEGGEFEFSMSNDKGDDNCYGSRKKGSLILFPSYLGHRVRPVSSGVRYSIVTWILGNSFK